MGGKWLKYINNTLTKKYYCCIKQYIYLCYSYKQHFKF